MKLEQECTKDILTAIEEHSGYGIKTIYPDQMMSLRDKYRDMKIRYHIVQASKAGLIELSKIDDSNRMYIADLTPAGHKFLSNIRSNSFLSKLKHLFSFIGSTALPHAIKLAFSLIQDSAKKLIN